MIAGVIHEKLCLFDFEQRKAIGATMRRVSLFFGAEFVQGKHRLFEKLETEIAAYFSGELQTFSLPIQFSGTPFQIEVWQQLQTIEYGTTRSYQEQARLIGNEKAVRAIAMINGMNSLAIVVPCHRVIASNGALTGYSGGLAAKKRLLAHEQKHAGLAMQGELF